MAVWLLSLLTATIYSYIFSEVTELRGNGLLTAGFAFFLLFGGISAGCFAEKQISKTLRILWPVLAGAAGVALLLHPRQEFVLLFSLMTGLVWSGICLDLFRREVNHLRLFSVIYFGLSVALLLPLTGISFLKVSACYAAVIMYWLYAFWLTLDNREATETEPVQEIRINKVAVFIFLLALAVETLTFLWMYIFSVADKGKEPVAELLALTLSLFVFRRFAGRPIIERAGFGSLFFCSILITISLGFLFVIHIPWLFIPVLLAGTAWYPAMISRTLQLKLSVRSWAWIFLALAFLLLMSGYLLMVFYTFLEGMAIPEKLYLLAMQQSLLKELAFFSAILIVYFGFKKFRQLWRFVFQKP